MSSSFFYFQPEKNGTNAEIVNKLESFSEQHKKQVYIIDRPLGDSKYSYNYNDGLVLLIPNHKIVFVDTGNDPDSFDDFVEDFIEDLGSISDKFRYKDVIGRPRSWRPELTNQVRAAEVNEIEAFLKENELTSEEMKKKCELLISLLTGSINDIDKVKADIPDNVLDKVKQKILLFDGDQTRFVYQQPANKIVTIQGLSGTGKTELLLHKLKEIYTEKPESKVIFTCHNKILADNLRSRIPQFFDFMKVEEQIKWDERLWCIYAWGSGYVSNSGTYRYICNFYNIDFHTYSPTTNFDFVCKKAIDQIRNKENIEHAFDYMLIDESQDFPESFFELCELVTSNTVYIAGDIFQSIFDDRVISEIKPDFLLSKCYRTDPKTLMFAHALGMGLFERPKLRWLEDNEWKACGYILNKNNQNNQYELSREPLRRFEDLEQEGFTSTELVKTSKDLGEDAETKILQIIHAIKAENPTVLPDDIGIIFIDNTKNTYATADKLEISVPRDFGWNVNKAYESKQKVKDSLFVSNKNNVKGLEFPFVICVTKTLNISRSYRNALYMMLTRSFLRTYLLISQDSNGDLTEKIEAGLTGIQNDGILSVQPPTPEEQAEIVTAFNVTEEKISFYDFVENIFDELDVAPLFRKPLHEVVTATVGESFDYETVLEVAEFNYSRMNKGA